MITLSQLVFTTLIVFVITRTIAAYRNRKLSRSFVGLWSVFWIGVVVLVFNQSLVSQFANSIGISRGVDLIIYISLVAIFYFIWRFLIAFYEIDRKITKVIREVAIRNAKKGTKKK